MSTEERDIRNRRDMDIRSQRERKGKSGRRRHHQKWEVIEKLSVSGGEMNLRAYMESQFQTEEERAGHGTGVNRVKVMRIS